MTLVAAPNRTYGLPDVISVGARTALMHYDPANLPAASYDGRWQDAPVINLSNHNLRFIKDANTRFLSSIVEINGIAFPLRTFGISLHMASGGGIVEHLLQDDKDALAEALSVPLGARFRNPLVWLTNLVNATKDCLDSRIHVHLLDRRQGINQADDIGRSVSKQYEEEIISDLTGALATIDRATFGVAMSLIILVATIFALLAWHPWNSAILAMRIKSGVAAVSYGTTWIVAAITALATLGPRLIAPLLFARPEQESVLRCLSNIHGARKWARIAPILIAGLLLIIAILRVS